jgi:hypothetical protein
MSAFANYDTKRVNDAVKALRPHFDTVQVFCTRCSADTGDTQTMTQGSGNWYARYGQIKAFVNDIEKGYIVSIEKGQEI